MRFIKTSAYAIVAVSTLTALGHIARFCMGRCLPRSGWSIAFGLFASVLALVMVGLWFAPGELAERIDIYCVHALFFLVIVATATGAMQADNSLANFANFAALVVTTFLCVHTWNAVLDARDEAAEEEEEEEEEEDDEEKTSQMYSQSTSV